MKSLAAILLFFAFTQAQSQPISAEGRGGLSVFTGNGGSTGLLLGGLLDIPVQGRISAMPHLTITTHTGTPIELGGLLKYTPPYLFAGGKSFLDAGLGIWFYSGGSALGLDFGAGAHFPLSDSKMSIPVEFRMGPVFESGNSVFQFSISSGIRFDIQ
jgi:hypothetical protein